MAFGHSSSGQISLDGVQFKLSEVFTSKPKVLFSVDIDLKDPDVLLEDLEYDFHVEHKLLADAQRKQMEEEEKRRLEQEERDHEKQELEERHRQFMMEKQKEEEEKQLKEKIKEDQNDGVVKSRKLSPSNPFFNDLMGKDILTPQPASPDKGQSGAEQRASVNVREFETEAPDPFSDMELKTIDDLEELKDVLQIVSTNSGKQSPEETALDKEKEPLKDRSPNESTDTDSKKSIVIDQLTDLLTDDFKSVERTSHDHVTHQSSPKVTPRSRRPKPVAPHHSSQSPPGFLPPITTSLAMNHDSSSAAETPSPVFHQSAETPGQSTSIFEINDLRPSKDISSGQHVHAPLPSKSENVYQNIPPTVKPRVGPRKVNKQAQERVSSSAAKETNSNSYGAVRDRVLANKTATERAKFEDTINKALTSLPQLPVIAPKPHPLDDNDQQGVEEQIKPRHTTMASPRPLSPSLLSGLTETEREFALSLVSMGFKEQDVVRTMQKHGTDHKEVIEHLIVLQRLVEQHFGTKNIEEALDIFNGDEKEAVKFLQLERQFIDMGFSSEKIKEALLLTDRNQEKALGILMGES